MGQEVWVFHGEGGRFASGVFSTRVNAEAWIASNKLTGVLTSYPVDIGAYDHAISRQFFEAKNENQRSPKFIQQFTSGSQDHYHYSDGIQD